MLGKKQKYVAFLRGINVGGHHKVPMAELKEVLQKMKFDNVITLLNSGNIIFESSEENIDKLETQIAKQLERSFGFSVPTLIRTKDAILNLIEKDPFKVIAANKDIRLYVSFIRAGNTVNLELPWQTKDNAYQILHAENEIISSVLDLSVFQTPKAMNTLEKFYGKDITTRNWKTIKRIEAKL
ncbi:MAG: DUF1697 domain-containing protein [Flavobacteriaceae bacterium]|nr:DUF1697 domain-containing protein [Flavobacteriaceae bacterium]